MRLYAGRIQAMAEDIIRTLRDSEAIEVELEAVHEAELDVQGVLREYQRTDRDLATKAREMADSGGGSFGRLKRQLAYRSGFKLGDEAVDYVVDQLIETFLHSHHVEEVFVDDRELRKQISTIVKKHTADMGDQLDEKVRARIKNLEEGSVAWDSEYERVMKKIRREKKLD